MKRTRSFLPALCLMLSPATASAVSADSPVGLDERETELIEELTPVPSGSDL